MANLTIIVDDHALQRAHIRAIEQGTSVNAILADRLRAFASEGEAQARATRSLVALARENTRRAGRPKDMAVSRVAGKRPR